jgi:hypothetical protein
MTASKTLRHGPSSENAFSILEGKSLHVASTSVRPPRDHIDAFINEHVKPFVWTKTKVHQRRVKGRRISQL